MPTLFRMLASAREGLSEQELDDVLARQLPKLAEDDRRSAMQVVLRQVRVYLMRKTAARGALIDFYHRSLWKAVRAKYLLDEAAGRQSHHDLADYFAEQPYYLGQPDPADPKSTIRIPHERKVVELPCQYLAAEDWDGLEAVFTDLPFLEAKVAAGMAFELAGDFTAAVADLPADRPQRRIIRLLGEALRRDLQFIARHAEDYPQGLFQCLWNTGWWYDSPAAEGHYEPPEGGWPAEGPPWQREGAKLCELLEQWQTEKKALPVDVKVLPLAAKALAIAAKDLGAGLKAFGLDRSTTGGHQRLWHWLRSSRPPTLPLGSAQLVQLTGHTRPVNSVAFSPDGRRIASGSGDGAVRIWDADSGEPIAHLTGHTDHATSVAFSPDGRRIASGSEDKTVRIWDADSGEPIAQLTGHTDHVTSVAFSPDGRRIASGSMDETVRVWDADSGEPIAQLTGHTDSVWSVAFSPDGRRIVSGSVDKTVRVWDASSGQLSAQLIGHTESVRDVEFNPDGSRIASGAWDKTVRIWDADNGQQIVKITGHPGNINCVAFSPDGRRIAGGGSTDNRIRVWDTGSGEPIVDLIGHMNQVWSVVFSPDGRRIVSGSDDKTVRLWDADDDQQIAELTGHTDYVMSVAFSPDGRRIASGSVDKTVRIWDAGSGKTIAQLTGHTGHVRSVAFSPDGRYVASGSEDKTVRVWDSDSVETSAQLNRSWRVLLGRFAAYAHGGKCLQIISNSRTANNVGETWVFPVVVS